MDMKDEHFQAATDAGFEVYKKHKDLGTTEYAVTYKEILGKKWQILAVAGTNELRDWWENFKILFAIKGIKRPGYLAAQEILANFVPDSDCELMIVVHSKSGPTGVALKQKFPDVACVMFSPARSVRYWSRIILKNTVIFVDPDDIVPWMGLTLFTHPKVDLTIKGKKDKFILDIPGRIGDHLMEYWKEFMEKFNLDEYLFKGKTP